jgi:hypothetical protein
MSEPNRIMVRRNITIPEEIWTDITTLSMLRHTTVSAEIRRLLLSEIAGARTAGEMPKARRRKVRAA